MKTINLLLLIGFMVSAANSTFYEVKDGNQNINLPQYDTTYGYNTGCNFEFYL